jgi:prevent-host-death family protein
MGEKRTGIRDLKARLSSYVREIKKGNTVVITERGVDVARIIPVSQPVEDRIDSLIRSGFADWNRKKLNPGKPAAKIRRGSKTLAKMVSEDRD